MEVTDKIVDIDKSSADKDYLECPVCDKYIYLADFKRHCQKLAHVRTFNILALLRDKKKVIGYITWKMRLHNELLNDALNNIINVPLNDPMIFEKDNEICP